MKEGEQETAQKIEPEKNQKKEQGKYEDILYLPRSPGMMRR